MAAFSASVLGAGGCLVGVLEVAPCGALGATFLGCAEGPEREGVPGAAAAPGRAGAEREGVPGAAVAPGRAGAKREDVPGTVEDPGREGPPGAAAAPGRAGAEREGGTPGRAGAERTGVPGAAAADPERAERGCCCKLPAGVLVVLASMVGSGAWLCQVGCAAAGRLAPGNQGRAPTAAGRLSLARTQLSLPADEPGPPATLVAIWDAMPLPSLETHYPCNLTPPCCLPARKRALETI